MPHAWANLGANRASQSWPGPIPSQGSVCAHSKGAGAACVPGGAAWRGALGQPSGGCSVGRRGAAS